jgi:hypothetical protein
MDLATLQRQLRDLLISSTSPEADVAPYIRTVAGSEQLALMQEITAWWRAYDLERYCTLTTALLKQLGIFETTVQTFVRQQRPSPFIEVFGATFLEMMSTHGEPRIATIARFESALIRVHQSDPTTYVITWQDEPYTFIQNLLTQRPINENGAQGVYQTIVASHLPQGFEVVQPIE